MGLRRYIWSNVSFSRSFSSQRTPQYVLPCQSNRASDGFFDEAHLSACYNTIRLIAFVVYLICRYCCDCCWSGFLQAKKRKKEKHPKHWHLYSEVLTGKMHFNCTNVLLVGKTQDSTIKLGSGKWLTWEYFRPVDRTPTCPFGAIDLIHSFLWLAMLKV